MSDATKPEFLGDNYLLENESARKLFATIHDLPIVDAHNHADIVEIVDNQPWSDLWVVEGATDHYVWEMMRKRGVAEDLITGNASNHDKWLALAEIFPELAGNPTYEWIHLDLRRRFGIDDVISGVTAESIWQRTKDHLAEPEMRPQAVLETMGVEVMCTTDEPTMSLPHHERARDEIETTRILPTWRPDKAMKIEWEGWKDWVRDLCEEAGENASSLDGFLAALRATHDYFSSLGCVASDHGLTVPWSHDVDPVRARRIHDQVMGGRRVTDDQVVDYHAFMLREFARINAAAGWVMQIHMGAVRDYRDTLFAGFGPDSGGDLSDHSIGIVQQLRPLLNEVDGRLKIVLYSLDPTHAASLATISRAFPNVSLGAPWWFNDSPNGMESSLRYVGTVDLLANHAGMVTDSRKLISFGSRTEMWRRAMCNTIGAMVERGQLPMAAAEALTRGLAYEQPKRLFFGSTRSSH
jgi:glucuronate isomerase